MNYYIWLTFCMFGFILLLVLFRNVLPKNRAIRECRKILKDLAYTARNGDSDPEAMNKWHNLQYYMHDYTVMPNEIGIDDAKLTIVKQNAYNAFCLYMANWRHQHGMLEDRLICAQKLPRHLYLKEIEHLGPILSSSAETLKELEKQTGKLNLKFSSTMSSQPDTITPVRGLAAI